MPGHPQLTWLHPPLSAHTVPHVRAPPCRAAEDAVLEEQIRTGEPQVWPPAQKQDAGTSETPGPRRHRDTDNTFVKNKCS